MAAMSIVYVEMPRQSRRAGVFGSIVATMNGRAGLAGVVVLLFAAIAGPWLLGTDPLEMVHTDQFKSPSLEHPMGTDELGRDVFSRVLSGLRVSLLVGVGSVAAGGMVGVISGTLAGYVGGRLERWTMRFWDAALAFPAIILGIATAVVLGPSRANALVAVAIVNMPQFARLSRASTLVEKHKEYVEASRSSGATSARIVLRGIWPNTAALTLVQATIAVPRAILLEATLGFLGLGQQAPFPSLGGMVSDSRQFLTYAPWYAFFPGLTIALLVLCFTLLGSRLADILDPRRRWTPGR
jgi:peptide/nickel transport system permease protein